MQRIDTNLCYSTCHELVSMSFPPLSHYTCVFSQRVRRILMEPKSLAVIHSLAFQNSCFPSYIRSFLILFSPSTVTTIVDIVVRIEARVVDEEIMNIIIICKIAACWTEEPPRMAPVIIPGIETIPMTLEAPNASLKTIKLRTQTCTSFGLLQA